jgi:methionyl-tRNA formyltransferase
MRIVLLSRLPRFYPLRGDRLLRQLASENHEVVAVVVERTSTVASLREWIEKFGPRVFAKKVIGKVHGLVRLRGGREDASAHNSGAELAAVRPRVFEVGSLNSPASVELVRSLCPDVVVLRNCGIIRKPILEIPRLGTLNPHYGLLPAYRGVDVTEWAALHGDTIAVTVHFVSEGVDTGAVLASRVIPVQRGDTLGLLRAKSAAVAAELLADVLTQLDKCSITAIPQRPDEGRQYFAMHPRLRQLASERLKRWPK